MPIQRVGNVIIVVRPAESDKHSDEMRVLLNQLLDSVLKSVDLRIRLTSFGTETRVGGTDTVILDVEVLQGEVLEGRRLDSNILVLLRRVIGWCGA